VSKTVSKNVSKTKIVFFIHGVNTPMTKDFANYLRNHLPEDVLLIVIWWPSTGTMVGDILHFHEFLRAIGIARENMEEQIKAVGMPGLVICHSMGQVVRMHLSLPPEIPTISLGGPLHNQFLSRFFRSFGLAPRTPKNIISFYNPDDPIVGKFPRKLKGAKNVMIDVPDKHPYKDEHEILLYLEDDLVKSCIESCIDKQAHS